MHLGISLILILGLIWPYVIATSLRAIVLTVLPVSPIVVLSVVLLHHHDDAARLR